MQAFQNYLLVGFWLLFGFDNPPKKGDAVFIGRKSVSAAQLIVPGKSIGQTKLQEDAVLVYKRLGRPDAGDAAMGKSLATWYAGHRPSGYQTQVFFSRYMGGMEDTTSRVKQIRVTSPYFKTAAGIGPGSALKQINAVFRLNKTAAFTEHKQRCFIYDTFKGIAFESNAGGKCTGVIVYLSGGRGGFTYLPFHSN